MKDLRETISGRKHLAEEERALALWRLNGRDSTPDKLKIARFGSVENYARLLESGTVRRFMLINPHAFDVGKVWTRRWLKAKSNYGHIYNEAGVDSGGISRFAKGERGDS
jgi:hypothetical protein